MMVEAKLFQSGNSQAIRLPKEYRLEGESVHLNRIGNLLVIVPMDDPWKSFVDGVRGADDFPVVNNSNLKLKRVSLK
jgi:antitoxin VapB